MASVGVRYIVDDVESAIAFYTKLLEPASRDERASRSPARGA